MEGATQTIRPPDPIQWDKYSDGGAGKVLPPKGEYTLTPTKLEVGRTSEGYLQVIVDVTVTDPGKPWDGFLSRFNRFNTKKWPNREGNGLGDYLRAHGIAGPLETDAQYEAAAQATLNRPFRGVLDWEIYDSATGFKLKGYENFPTDAQGQKVSRVNNNGTTHFANVRVKYPVSALKK